MAPSDQVLVRSELLIHLRLGFADPHRVFRLSVGSSQKGLSNASPFWMEIIVAKTAAFTFSLRKCVEPSTKSTCAPLFSLVICQKHAKSVRIRTDFFHA